MCTVDHILLRSLVILSCFLFVEYGEAQSGLNLTVGESSLFDVKPEQGITYCWRVLDSINQKRDKETENVVFLSTKCSSSVYLKWAKAGTYYLEVRGVNQNGCSNYKIIYVNIQENHFPVANNDYGSTDWLKSIVVNLLNNDHDIDNDLEIASLKILTKPAYGEIIMGLNGSITYKPLKKWAGTDEFKYQICDACNQCDTATVSIKVHDPPLLLPQAISPNGDGINDRFVVNGLYAYPKTSLTIFSRDGIVVFKSNDYQNDWEGVFSKRGDGWKKLPSGTYYYLLHPGGTDRIIKGFIYLAE